MTTLDTITEAEKWVTINGSAVKIDGDGVVLTGPMKGKDLDSLKGSGDKGDDTADAKDTSGQADAKAKVTDKPEFKKWFGKSKVVDKDGNPRVVYHGTRKGGFSIFNDSRAGIFFSDSSEEADRFSAPIGRSRESNIKPVFLKIENPGVVDYKGALFDRRSFDTTIRTALSRGHDGVIFKDIVNVDGAKPSTTFVVFKSTQIKSATGNKGTFDPSNPDIRESTLRESTNTLDQIRTAGESRLQSLLADLDTRHRKMLRDAIVLYGRVQDIPQGIWDAIRKDMENEEIAAAILALIIMGDDWTTGEIRNQGARGLGMNAERLSGYALDAARRTQTMAAQTTDTLRDRLARKIEDSRLTGPGAVGELTKDGIEQSVDEVLTVQRRKTIAADQTTKSISRGQIGAKNRIGGDGAETIAGQKVTIELIWRNHPERSQSGKSCPKCEALNGQPESVWGSVYPSGPGDDAHEHCNCDLQPQVVVEQNTEAAA